MTSLGLSAPPPIPQAVRPERNHWRLLLLLFPVIAVAFIYNIATDHRSDTRRRVTIMIDGPECVLAYASEAGAANQFKVHPPFTLEFRLHHGAFVYLSAQNQTDHGSLDTGAELWLNLQSAYQAWASKRNYYAIPTTDTT